MNDENRAQTERSPVSDEWKLVNVPYVSALSEAQFDFVFQKSGPEERGFKRDDGSVEFVQIPRRAKNDAPVPSHRNSHY
jgi:hypothetical protein